ncbi:PREDICTED: translation initiation factor IF-2-like [Capra hircus]|uniref:translation initiation factor IF-2-like n=1 Tax=Capra hircus TaxID=9925 RepID=UPI0008467735|nr:PREDICTED: translation initiation factor IF-2-like [Capra hircus]
MGLWGLRSGDTWEPESLSGPGPLSGGVATGGAGWTPACRALNANDKPLPRSPGRGLGPPHPLPRLLPSAGRSQEGCTRGRPFKSASLRLQAAQAEGPQLLRRHQSRPPGPDRVAGGAGEPGGRQVWADSPFIPRLGRAQTSGRPCSPCGACPYRAWRPGEGRGYGGAGCPGGCALGPGGHRASILAGLRDLGPVAALLCASASAAALLPAQEALALGGLATAGSPGKSCLLLFFSRDLKLSCCLWEEKRRAL